MMVCLYIYTNILNNPLEDLHELIIIDYGFKIFKNKSVRKVLIYAIFFSTKKFMYIKIVN